MERSFDNGSRFLGKHTLGYYAVHVPTTINLIYVAPAKADFNRVKTIMEQFLADFRRTVESSKARLLDIPAHEAGQGTEDKWSAKQIIGHLIDSACNNHQRFVRAQFTNDLVCSGYDQEAWVSSQKYNDETWPDLVHLWAAYNLHLLHVISVMPEDVLTRVRKEHNLDQIAFKAVDRNTPTTLEYFVRDYADHMRHHLVQIFGTNA